MEISVRSWFDYLEKNSWLNDLAYYLREGEIIKKVELAGGTLGIFFQVPKEMPVMSCRYLMLCYHRGEARFLFSINLETSLFGTCYIGVCKEGCHCTVMPASLDMRFEDFMEKALDIAGKILAGEFCKRCEEIDPGSTYFLD